MIPRSERISVVLARTKAPQPFVYSRARLGLIKHKHADECRIDEARLSLSLSRRNEPGISGRSQSIPRESARRLNEGAAREAAGRKLGRASSFPINDGIRIPAAIRPSVTVIPRADNPETWRVSARARARARMSNRHRENGNRPHAGDLTYATSVAAESTGWRDEGETRGGVCRSASSRLQRENGIRPCANVLYEKNGIQVHYSR